jgi:hypothetical protein
MSEPAAITSVHAPDVDDVRQWMEKMIKAMRLVELVTAIVALITRMRDANTELTKRLADLRRKRPRSETLRRIENQLMFVFAARAPDQEEPAAAASDERGKTTQKQPTRKGRHPGRAGLPAHLERVPESNPVPPELRRCPLCGGEMKTVGHSMCEILDVRPAQLFVRQRYDERVSCSVDKVMVSAPTPEAGAADRARQARHHACHRVSGGQVPRAAADRAAVPSMGARGGGDRAAHLGSLRGRGG